MDVHGNARLTPHGRVGLCENGVGEWDGRFRTEGLGGPRGAMERWNFLGLGVVRDDAAGMTRPG